MSTPAASMRSHPSAPVDEVLVRPPVHAAADVVAAGQAATPAGALTLRRQLHAVERNILVHTLESTEWNVSAAARRLGLTRVGLHRKLQSFGIRRPHDERRGAGDRRIPES